MTTPFDMSSLFLRRAEQALAGAGLLLDGRDPAGSSSRACFATFHAACAALTSVRPDLGDGIQTHDELAGAFAEHGDAALVRSLDQVRKLRLMVDHSGDSPTYDDARGAVTEAEQFLAEIKRRFPAL